MHTFADSHAHLDFPDYADDRREVLNRARAAGVRFINLIATRLEKIDEVTDLCAGDSDLFASVGIHPHYAAEAPDASVEAILAAARHPRVVAIGETGLDFHYDFSPRPRQEEVFRAQIRAAHAAGLPLVIHTREAEVETRRIVEEEDGGRCGGVVHCFTGSAEMARWAVGQGFYLSFSGVITFKNAAPLREIAAWLPLERILVETDAPYLAPIPYRGKRNEPAHVVHVAAAVAAARGVEVGEIAAATTANFRRLFRVQEAGDGPGRLAYPIGRNLYLNISRGCTNHCAFCPKWEAPVVHRYDLALTRNPTAQEVIQAMGDISGWEEVVFCGYGEPTLRLEVLLEVAAEVKRRGGRVRVNTDGLLNRVRREDVTPRLAGLVDTLSVSLNAQDAETYARHCQPAFPDAYAAVKAFIVAAKVHVPMVVVSALEGLEGVDVEACRRIAEEELGVCFRRRVYGRLG